MPKAKKHKPVTTAPFSYDNLRQTPKGYECGVCGAKGVKLWREWNTFLCYQTLYCAECALGGQPPKKPISGLERSDQIEHPKKGTLAPAIPTQEGDTYWGYTSVPTLGIIWWKSLPRVEGQDDWSDEDLLEMYSQYKGHMELWDTSLAKPDLREESKEYYGRLRDSTLEGLEALKKEIKLRSIEKGDAFRKKVFVKFL